MKRSTLSQRERQRNKSLVANNKNKSRVHGLGEKKRNYLVKVLVSVMADADTSLVFLREADVLTSAPCTVLWRHLRTGSEAL